jgi:thioredoxin:protein disulfide reductase
MSTRFALLAVLVTFMALPARAAEPLMSTAPRPALTQDPSGGVTPVDQAFAFSTVVEADGDLILMWEMPPAFYLYRKSLKLERDGADLLPTLELPEGTLVTDEFFGESEVYFERLLARLPAAALNAAPGTTIDLQLSYQGCLEDIYCYPPQYKTVNVALP